MCRVRLSRKLPSDGEVTRKGLSKTRSMLPQPDRKGYRDKRPQGNEGSPSAVIPSFEKLADELFFRPFAFPLGWAQGQLRCAS